MMTTHQKTARMQVQYNGPGFLGFCHRLTPEELAFTRHEGRGLDAGGRSLRESQAQAAADLEAAEEERRNIERRMRRKEERQAKAAEMIEGFEPILNLSEFRLLPAAEPANKFLQQQLVWHRIVGGDKGLPAGLFTSMNKETMKELIVEALERRDKVIAVNVDEVEPCSKGPKPSKSENPVDDRMDTDVALISDDSEAELELVDKVGLSLSKDTRSSPPDLVGPTHILAPTPGSSSLSTSTPPLYQFGCRWDAVDYSCSYDCVFMTFAWIYFHATHTWRAMWTGESAATKALSHHFKAISRAFERPTNNRSTTAALFSSGRDAFRDILSEEDPSMFKRRGRVYAGVADVLNSLSHNRTSSKFFSSTASCGGPRCTLKVTTPAGAPFMLSPNTWNSITKSTDQPYHESLQKWLLGFFDLKLSSLPHRCSGCDRERSHTLSFLRPPWIWFDIFVEHPHVVLPSFKISLASHTYRLAAVIYGNTHHFVARLSTPLGMWWYYDGMVNGGQPVVDTVSREEDLIVCGGGYTMNALVYCLT